MDEQKPPLRLLNAADIRAKLQDPATVDERWRRYEAEMFRRFGPREKWPKTESELTPEEKREREALRRAVLARMDFEEEQAARGVPVSKEWPTFSYDKPASKPAPSIWPPALDLTALATRAPSEPPFIITGWLPLLLLTLLAGHGGVGKSGIALHIAVCIAFGHHFFGLAVERSMKVIYLSCEDPEYILHWRLARICAYEGIPLDQLAGLLDVIDLVGRDSILFGTPDRMTGESRTLGYYELIERVQAQGEPVLVVVDGISDTFGGNENSKTEVKQYVNALLAVVRELGGAVMLIGHVAKPAASAPNTSEGYSGTTGWHNAARARWYLYPETEPGDDFSGGRLNRTGRLFLELQKSNYGRADQMMSFVWDDAHQLFVGEQVQSVASPSGRSAQEAVETQGILDAGRAAMSKGIKVPAASTGPHTAFHVLSAEPSFPASLKGQPNRRRFQRLLREMQSQQLVEVQTFLDAARRPRQKLVFL